MRVSIRDLGEVGIVQSSDTPAHMLPVNAWTNGRNVRFQDNKVVKCLGHSAVFDPPSIAPYWIIGVPTNSTMYWVYAGLESVFVVDPSNVHTDITRAAGSYNTDSDLSWNGGILGGITILNNAVDPPQFWADADPGTPLADLTNWPANTTAGIIRPFKNFLVAGNITKSGINYPHLVKWSHPAAPGSVPVSWDETDATKDTGEANLSEIQTGVIKDMLSLGDALMVYKNAAVHGMQYVGGQNIFRVYDILTSTGILSQNCVAALPNSRGHFVATGDDLIVHDGQPGSVKSVVDKRWRKFITENISEESFSRSFCVANDAQKEMMFCFPEGDNTYPNLAMLYSLVDGSIGVRELSNFAFIASGTISITAPASDWASDSDTWDSDPASWAAQAFAPYVHRLLACDPIDTKLFRLDYTNQFNDTSMTSFVERQGLTIAGVDRSGNPYSNFAMRKLVSRIWPRMTGGPVTINIGAQEDTNESVVWGNAVTFTPGTDLYADFDSPVSGRLIALHIESIGNVSWELESYDLEIEQLGEL